MKVISEFIAPWALAKEDIPIHMIWKSELPYDTIRIRLPEKFKVHELFNVDEHLAKGLTILIKRLKTSNYFGLVVFASETYKENLTRKEITIEFLSHGEVKYSHTFTARVIRPLLEVMKAPEKIVVREDIDPRKLINLSVKYSGLGTAKIAIKVGHKGATISYTDSLYRQILKRLINEKIFLSHELKEVVSREDIEIDPESLKKLSEEMVERMKTGRGILPSDIDQETLREFNEWIKDSKNINKLMNIVYSEIEQLMIGAILYYLDRHPSEDIELIGGITKTIFKSRVKEMIIRIHYKDSLDNEYEPIEIPIKVDDQRKNVERIFEAPINIEWITKRIGPGV